MGPQNIRKEQTTAIFEKRRTQHSINYVRPVRRDATVTEYFMYRDLIIGLEHFLNSFLIDSQA